MLAYISAITKKIAANFYNTSSLLLLIVLNSDSGVNFLINFPILATDLAIASVADMCGTLTHYGKTPLYLASDTEVYW